MKQILEYLVNNHVKNAENIISAKIGDRFKIDGVPCTLIYISGDKHFVISDIFTGQIYDSNKHKLINVYTNINTVKNDNEYLWKKPQRFKPDYLPEGWEFPTDDGWINKSDIMCNAGRYIWLYNSTFTMWMLSVKDKYKRKHFVPYNIARKCIEPSTTTCGIRFVKII